EMTCPSPRPSFTNHRSMGAVLSRPSGSSSTNVESVIKPWSEKALGRSIRQAAGWTVLKQRVLTRDVAGGSTEAVALIHRPDASGNLVQSERIVSREWAVGGQAFHTDEIYRRDINNGGSLTRQPVQQVEIVQTTPSDGGFDTARGRKS